MDIDSVSTIYIDLFSFEPWNIDNIDNIDSLRAA